MDKNGYLDKYQIALEDIETQKAQERRKAISDMAARGMLNSGGYEEALQEIDKKYDRKKEALTREKNRYLQKIQLEVEELTSGPAKTYTTLK